MALSRDVYRELRGYLRARKHVSVEPVVLEELLMDDGTNNSSYISPEEE